ncbi:MAG: cytochrome c biogenesis protein CcsA [Bacteroidota bacterium]
MVYEGEWLWLGNLGHGAVIVAFCAALLGVLTYGHALFGHRLPQGRWETWGRWAFGLHSVAVLTVIGVLFGLIFYHRYEYHYAWSHASKALPVRYILSAFWEGQEGSFLLWIFWHVLLGNFFIISSGRRWEAGVMTVLSLAQLMLSSMLLGTLLEIPALGELKIGSSPFVLLRDTLEAPLFQRPDYLKWITDGNGLNPLLQNPWMVIHPPVLFLGFASCTLPFGYAVTALVRGLYREWVGPALGWTLVSVLTLGSGIVMGAAWAYESLNFGGYWAWDPVENASLLPWLFMVGAFHGMHAFTKSGYSLKSTLMMVMMGFVLVLYATFLTRSGILGESSVHSFTDLGLSGQLLAFLGLFTLLTVILLVYRWKQIPGKEKGGEESGTSREFWLFVGSMTLVVSAFQILLTTSIPVFNAIAGSNMAPPTDAVAYYNRWQLPLAVFIILMGTTAFRLRFGRSEPAKVLTWMMGVTAIAVVMTLVVGYTQQIGFWSYLLLVFAACFALVGNGHQLFQARQKLPSQGGLLAHLGFALLMLGVLVSSARKEVVSLNLEGTPLGENFSPAQARENVLLYQNQAKGMAGYLVTYTGDSVAGPNRYYRLLFQKKDPQGKLIFQKTLYPNAQINPKMGLIASPATLHFWDHDLYMHVTQVPDPANFEVQSRSYADPVLHYLDARGDTLMLKESLVLFGGLQKLVDDRWAQEAAGADIAVYAPLRIRRLNQEFQLKPVYILRQGVEFRYPDQTPEPGIRVELQKIDPQTEQIALSIQSLQPAPRAYVVLKMLRFPWINAVWYGSFLLVGGLSLSVIHRNRQYQRERTAD